MFNNNKYRMQTLRFGFCIIQVGIQYKLKNLREISRKKKSYFILRKTWYMKMYTYSVFFENIY